MINFVLAPYKFTQVVSRTESVKLLTLFWKLRPEKDARLSLLPRKRLDA